MFNRTFFHQPLQAPFFIPAAQLAYEQPRDVQLKTGATDLLQTLPYVSFCLRSLPPFYGYLLPLRIVACPLSTLLFHTASQVSISKALSSGVAGRPAE